MLLQSQQPGRQMQSMDGQASPLFAGYGRHATAWDELFTEPDRPHGHTRLIVERLGRLQPAEFQQRRASADLVFVNQGVTFSVYSDRRGVEKIFPFDLIPRPVAAAEWQTLEAGLVQRIQALNLFLHDVYHDRRILREGVIPEEMVLKSKGYRPEMIGFDPPGRQYLHVVGTDLVRDPAGRFLVLEDNGRTPSGVSYVLENRIVMKKVFPELFQHCHVRRVEDYPHRLREALGSVAPPAPPTRPASSCCRRGRTTPPTSSTASLPATWASNWFSARTCSSTTTRSSSKQRAARSAWTSSTAAWTTTFWIPRRSGPTACSACPVFSPPTGPAT